MKMAIVMNMVLSGAFAVTIALVFAATSDRLAPKRRCDLWILATDQAALPTMPGQWREA
jgi:hypothetical protein